MDELIKLKTMVINERYVRQIRFDVVDGEDRATLRAEFWGDEAKALKQYVDTNPEIRRLI
jgi:hypothetical protein